MSRFGLINRLLGDSNEKEPKRLAAIVDEIDEFGEELAAAACEMRQRDEPGGGVVG
jgi:hypothetical protein